MSSVKFVIQTIDTALEAFSVAKPDWSSEKNATVIRRCDFNSPTRQAETKESPVRRRIRAYSPPK